MDPTKRQPGSQHGTHGEVRHETTDVNVRTVAWGLVSVGLLVVLAALLLVGVFRYFAERAERQDPELHPLAAERPEPPGPRLQPDPAVDMRQMRQSEEQLLNSYGWVDRERGLVRIPIERAMELVEQRGLPARQAQPGQYAAPPPRR
jgi:hypothetical protein